MGAEFGWVEGPAVPMPTMSAGDNGVIASVPTPTISSGTNDVAMSVPMITISADTPWASDLVAPMPTMTATLVIGIAISGDSIVPMVGLTATLQSGEVFTVDETVPMITMSASMDMILLETPMITMSASLLTGEAITVALTAPMPIMLVEASESLIITAANTLQMPQLSAALLTGNIAEVVAQVQMPQLSAAVLTGTVSTVELQMLMPTMSAAGYPAFVITSSITAPMPQMTAEMVSALPATYRTWVLNTRKGCLTEYDYQFNSYCVFNGQVLAAKSDGVFVLGVQALDGAAAISARARTGKHDYDSSMQKRVPRIYTEIKADGDMLFRTVTNETGERTYLLPYNHVVGYQMRRVPVGKGPKSPMWQYEVENVDGADFSVKTILAKPVKLPRRVQ